MSFLAVLNEYKCPNCAASVEFDSTSQTVKCPYCDSEFDIEAIEKANSIGQPDKDETNWSGAQSNWSENEETEIFVYCCNSCGGEIVADKTAAATMCPFCGNSVTVKERLSGDLKPDLIIPFKLDKNAAKEGYKKHISGKKLLPKLFKEENHIDEIKGIYVPYWLFDCEAYGSAVFGGLKTRVWSDGKFRYTKTLHYELHRSAKASFKAIPVDGSSKMPDELMESVEPFNIEEAKEFSSAYLAGFFADRYDVDREKTVVRANERVKSSLVSEMKKTTDGCSAVTEKRSSINVDNGLVRYALYPVWLLNTTYNGEKYVFAMNGQTGKTVGDLPLDKRAFWKWVGILGSGLSVVFSLLTLALAHF